MQPSIGLQSLAVSVPERVVTNGHWRERYPEIVAKAEERIWMWKKPKDWSEGSATFNREMAPYVLDPFRGARERRLMVPDGTVLELEAAAARQALEGADLDPREVDVLICTSFLPDSTGIGGAAFLAGELGLEGAAWNLETACSSATVAFQTACALVASGQYRNALVVTSCSYSRVAPESDPVSWGVGDAASAMVVGPVAEGIGLLGGHTVHSAATIGAVEYRLDLDEDGEPYFHLRTGKHAARLLRETSEGYLEECCGRALARAGAQLSDVDHFVFNTPLAWYAPFCAETLGVGRRRSISVYPLYANVGPVLPTLNLHHAAHWKRFRPGDLVLLYSVGSVSSCSAAVFRWGEVTLGPLPEGASLEHLRTLEAETMASYALGRVEEKVLAPVREHADPYRRLRRFVTDYTRLILAEPRVMDLFGEEDFGPEGHLRCPELTERRRGLIELLRETIVAAAASRSRTLRADPTVAALSLLAIVHWGALTYRKEGRVSEDEAVEQITVLALHGLGSRLEREPARATA